MKVLKTMQEGIDAASVVSAAQKMTGTENSYVDLSVTQLVYQQEALLRINKNIFMDLAWQHVAYLKGGLQEMRERYKAGDIKTPENLRIWEMLDSGRIDEANVGMMWREQHEIAQPIYDQIKAMQEAGQVNAGIWEYFTAAFATNPVPGGKDFEDAMSNGDLTVFDDRFQWMAQHAFIPFSRLSRREREELVLGAKLP